MASNARHSMPPGGYDGRNGAAARPGKPPLPHIDDLVAIPKDIDPNQSIKRLLEQAESALRQSEMSRDFNRPAIALKDYIRASIIAVQIVSKHQDYPSLRSNQGETARLHNTILKKISQQSEIYERIKQDVILDNKRTGVRPAVSNSASAPAMRNPPPLENGHPERPASYSPAKNKPAIQPKPASLHGNAINAGHNRANSTANATLDLAARFANLRGPQASPGQDPRIKTYSIVSNKPAGPREMPQSPQKVNVDTGSAAALPKLPDAIYSPARGSLSGEAARLPTSTPRGLFTRTGSSASIASTPSTTQPRQSNEYFPPVPPPPSTEPPPVPAKPVNIPEGDTISPEELYGAMKVKGSILIIDIRAREDFDEGHIMSSSVICIEPSILMRESISSDDISESMILSPNPEQALFEKRDSYDLVVFYDQDSESLPRSPKNSDDVVVMSLHRALVHLNYGRDLRNPPKLLRGGLDAWVDLMGQGSLQATPSAESKPSRINRRHGLITRRGSKYVVSSLRPADIKAWQNTLANESGPPSFPRTGDEFLRFPRISREQQSMVSTMSAEQRYKHDLANRFASQAQLPQPPARPRAAVQRPSHSGLSQDEEDEDAYADTGSGALPALQKTTSQTKKGMEQLAGSTAKKVTGLNNPRNWCYANSTLQSLLASPNFGRELSDSEWAKIYKNEKGGAIKVPRKQGEEMDQPQLMIQIISNLFHWMSYGNFQTMKAQMVMDYSRSLCKTGDPQTQFGGPDQQDAQEFMSFIMDQLHDETNLRRHRKGKVEQPDTKRQPLLRAAEAYWQNHLELNYSIVDRYWRGLDLSTVKCLQCMTRTYTFSPFEWLPVTVNQGRDMTLQEALQQHTAGNEIDDFECDHCRGKRRATQSLSLARMPPLLCIGFRRFHFDGRDITKSNTAITWDFNDFDFSPYFLNSHSDWEGVRTEDRAFSGPFRYECYAVIVHAGRQINTGHYYAYVRDSSTHDPYAWYLCNDSSVTKVRIGSRDSLDRQKSVFRSNTDQVPYLVFFRRKGG